MKKWIIKIILTILSITFLANSYHINGLSKNINGETKINLFPLPLSIEAKQNMITLIAKSYLCIGIGAVFITLIYFYASSKKEKTSQI
ncbi:hypothetical protein [Priestia aryabhattai]|uniref:hypothetical protein n=1 Tax=Priestia aryabhattai TaxID=412384 RepID=UPI002E1CEF86|nr:hypothetical protein [Priestia aryabhattai]